MHAEIVQRCQAANNLQRLTLVMHHCHFAFVCFLSFLSPIFYWSYFLSGTTFVNNKKNKKKPLSQKSSIQPQYCQAMSSSAQHAHSFKKQILICLFLSYWPSAIKPASSVHSLALLQIVLRTSEKTPRQARALGFITFAI